MSKKLVQGLWLAGQATTTDSTNWVLLTSINMGIDSPWPDGAAPGDCVLHCRGTILGWCSALNEGASMVGWRSFRWFNGDTLIGIETDPFQNMYSAFNTNLSGALSIRPHDSIADTLAFYVKGTFNRTVQWHGDLQLWLYEP